ncbi:trna ligase [Mycoemilia scoparia]|uniref:tRNA ligase n=1 Tax=Mycoemilia scoparia TaxID=417184 RepID=A0A9W8DR57_9FUNG|nr:trna ligase [Mycoemilia scoparia]
MSTSPDISVNTLVQSLHRLSNEKVSRRRIVNHTDYEVSGYMISSWKFNEFLYKKVPCPFPTMARGLFTGRKSSDDEDQDRILLRGYDKFFNIGETEKTSWNWITDETYGPYEMTVKENGCLILISALDHDTLIVTSKHAIDIPHSQAGAKWLDKHLNKSRKTKEDLASVLYGSNATAVFELCDDDFEEHILEYSPDERGLYLHGVNCNSVDLNTWPSNKVSALAKEFGFHETKYYVFNTVDEVKVFADKVQREHSLQGRAIEGFVIRCHKSENKAPHMFKIKYDEPYLMYREWRELTKQMLSGKPFKCRYKLSKAYSEWVRQDKGRNPQLYSEYNQNKGIIAARRRFLDYFEEKGGDINSVFESLPQTEKILIMPIATIACGKTTLSIALSELFGIGHIQNDNIVVKKRAREAFHEAIISELETKQVVIADRNNHIGTLRETLSIAIKDQFPNCKIIALYWSHDNISTDRMLKTATERVLKRGENHQSLTPERTPSFDKIVLRFLQGFEPLDQDSKYDNLIDDVVELNPLATPEDNLQAVIDKLCKMFPKKFKSPSTAEISRALEIARKYNPSIIKEVRTDKRKTKNGPPAYYGLAVNIDMEKWIDQNLLCSKNGQTNVDDEFYNRLKKEGLMLKSHHITLAHETAAKTNERHQNLFEFYDKAWTAIKNKDAINKNGLCTVSCHANYIVWDGCSMALAIDSMEASSELLDIMSSTNGNDTTVLNSHISNQILNKTSRQLASGNLIPHITLGHTNDVKAVRSNILLQKVFGNTQPDSNNNNESQDSQSIGNSDFSKVPVDLTFNAIFKRFVGRSI